MDYLEIKNMSLEELTKLTDSFLTFMGMDVTDITMKKRRKLLKKTIENLQYDNQYVEYCLSECKDEGECYEFLNRMNTTNMVIREVRQYLHYLPVEEKVFLKKIGKKEKL